MDQYFKLNKLKTIIVLMILLFFVVSTNALEKIERNTMKEKPIRGISIMLPVYSGRPNPQWWISEGSEFEKLINLIKSMKTVKGSLFNYDEWNRPGYASFWIVSREIEDLPKSVHIWRDMAYVPQNDEKIPLYVKGVTELYDMLVKQAEERGYRKFFLNYHKQKRKNKK